MTETATAEPDVFDQRVNASYWATCHEDHEQSWEENLAAARLYVDPLTGICACCGVNYHRADVLAHLDRLAERYSTDVLIQYLHAQAHEWGDDGTVVRIQAP